jgi:hypothetical protein
MAENGYNSMGAGIKEVSLGLRTDNSSVGTSKKIVK